MIVKVKADGTAGPVQPGLAEREIGTNSILLRDGSNHACVNGHVCVSMPGSPCHTCPLSHSTVFAGDD